jgi:hypothetical protein
MIPLLKGGRGIFVTYFLRIILNKATMPFLYPNALLLAIDSSVSLCYSFAILRGNKQYTNPLQDKTVKNRHHNRGITIRIQIFSVAAETAAWPRICFLRVTLMRRCLAASFSERRAHGISTRVAVR